jgi:Mn2+/Fe2+ NRAMP family transporter
MTLRRLSILQWFGFLAGGTIWWSSFLVGTGASIAVCNPASRRWDISHDTVELVLMVVAAAVVCSAQAAAFAVFRATRHVDDEDPPPDGRLHFFSIAAMLGNTLFLGVILLSGVATIVDRACHQS